MIFKLIQANRSSNNTVKVDTLWKKVMELPDKEAFKKGKPIFQSKQEMIDAISELEKDNCVMYSPEDGNVVLI